MAISRALPRLELMSFGIRSRFIDELALDAIARRGIATVVSLGCGLDATPVAPRPAGRFALDRGRSPGYARIQSGDDGFRDAATAGFSSSIVLGAALAAAAQPASRVVRIQPAEVLRAE